VFRQGTGVVGADDERRNSAEGEGKHTEGKGWLAGWLAAHSRADEGRNTENARCSEKMELIC